MRRGLRLGWLVLVLAAIGWMGCAPSDPDPSPDPSTPPTNPGTAARPTPPTVGGLRGRLEGALQHVWNRELRTDNSFWTIFHGILGMGFETTLTDPLTGKKINALEQICNGGEIRGMDFVLTPHGLDVTLGAGETLFVAQGHQDQFIAEMRQWGMTGDHVFKVKGKDYTFMDFVRQSTMRASLKANQELSWAIIIIGDFHGTNHRWTNERGEELHFEDIVRYELNAPIETNAACGGTHRLFGLTWALHRHLQKGGKKEGIWKEVAERLEKVERQARDTRSSDGLFSTKYLEEKDSAGDFNRKINTTGHVLEWLALQMTADELKQPWVQDAAMGLCNLILENSNRQIDSGSLYHAVHGLHIYHDRLFGPMKDRKAPLIPLPPGEELPRRPS